MSNQWCAKALAFIFVLSQVGCKQDNIKELQNGLSTNHVRLAKAHLQHYATCKNLLRDYQQRYLDEAKTNLAQWLENSSRSSTDPVAMAGSSGGIAPVATSPEGGSYTGTNNQEAGIDEADISKFDGTYIYTLNGNLLEITRVPEFGKIEYVSHLKFEQAPQEMLVLNQKALVFSAAPSGSNGSRIDVVDLSDIATPKIAHSIVIDGSYVTARRLADNRVLFVSSYSPNNPLPFPSMENGTADLSQFVLKQKKSYEDQIAKTTLQDFLPTLKMDDKALELHSNSCDNVYTAKDSNATNLVTVLSLDFSNGTLPLIAPNSIMSNTPVVYANANTLLLAEPSAPNYWYFGQQNFKDESNIHRFALINGETNYTGSGRVAGSIHDQFSLSEEAGNVRVASTLNPNRFGWGMLFPPTSSQESSNQITVLGGDKALDIVGKLENIAPGEIIYASRFYANHAYLVTFKQIDPLFTIDLTDPKNPKIGGSLKVEGVSTYLQEIDNGKHLLSVGHGGNQNGLDSRVQVSLFNVEDFSNPKLASSLSLRDGRQACSSSSEANNQHKAIAYFASQNALAIPVETNCQIGLGNAYESRLDVLNIAPGQPISFKGSIKQAAYSTIDGISYPNAIRRSYFAGTHLYAISPMVITVSALDNLSSILGAALLRGNQYQAPGWSN